MTKIEVFTLYSTQYVHVVLYYHSYVLFIPYVCLTNTFMSLPCRGYLLLFQYPASILIAVMTGQVSLQHSAILSCFLTEFSCSN